MKLTVALLLAPLALATAVPKVNQKVSYSGYKAYRIATGQHAASLKNKLAKFAAVQFNNFNFKTDQHVDVAISPDEIPAFEALGLTTEVMSDDLGLDIAQEGAFAPYEKVSAQAVPDLTWFNSYHAYNDHIKFFNDLQAAYPDNSEIFNIGNSVQGRSIFGIHLWGSGGKGSKPAVYFHGTVHAREWITSKVLEYITYQLLTGYNNDTTVKSFLDKYDFYILPVVNPDGFVYTQTNDRLWRKNRQTRSGASCVGTDVNRNWPYKWEVPGGASTNPCSETYKGEAAGDTPENKALVKFTQTLATGKGIKLYIDWHSYGQYILLPYGYDCDARTTDFARENSLAGSLAAAIRKPYGTRFTYGPSCSTLYATTGSSVDYLADVGKADLAWTIELRPTSSNGNGFVLPPAQILPASVEQWEGMKYLLAAM